jgi:hypothetical protein
MMCGRTRRGIGAWLGVAALLCQILLPFGLAQLADATGSGFSRQAAHHEHHHHHDPNLVNSLGPDWASGHSHAGDTPSTRVRLELGYLTPFAVFDPPAAPAVGVRWAAFVPDRMAPAPAGADSFTRPLPRAPPLPA